MQFDIKKCCPSISKDLLLKAINYTKRPVNINDDETRTIMNSRKPLLFSGTVVWIKKDGDKDFDPLRAVLWKRNNRLIQR